MHMQFRSTFSVGEKHTGHGIWGANPAITINMKRIPAVTPEHWACIYPAARNPALKPSGYALIAEN